MNACAHRARRNLCALLMSLTAYSCQLPAISTECIIGYTSITLVSLVAYRYMQLQLVHLKKTETKNSTQGKKIAQIFKKMSIALTLLARSSKALKQSFTQIKKDVQQLKQRRKKISIEQPQVPTEPIVQPALSTPNKTAPDEQIAALKKRIANL